MIGGGDLYAASNAQKRAKQRAKTEQKRAAAKRKAEKKKADLANESSVTVDDAATMMKEIDEAAGIHIEEDWLAQLNLKRAMKKVKEAESQEKPADSAE
jgi:hypothetical protein